MYLITFLLLAVFWIIKEIVSDPKVEKIFYWVSLSFLTLMSAFRYCQGTDYLSYKQIFEVSQTYSNVINNPHSLTAEIGFRFLCLLFPGNFDCFIMVIALFESWMVHRCLARYGQDRILSLIIFYPTVYMSYFLSIIREGIVIAVFLGVMLKLAEEKKWVQYFLITCLMAALHSVAILYLVVPLVGLFKKKIFVAFPAIVFGIGIIIYIVGGDIFARIPVVGEKICYYIYYKDKTFSMIAVAERLLTYGLIAVFYLHTERENATVRMLMNIYIVGITIYLVTFNMSLISSRTCILFKCVEIILIPMLCRETPLAKKLLVSYVLALSIVMTWKNIGSYLEQAPYKNSVTVWNYPYITVFRKERVFEYQNIHPIYREYY